VCHVENEAYVESEMTRQGGSVVNFSIGIEFLCEAEFSIIINKIQNFNHNF